MLIDWLTLIIDSDNLSTVQHGQLDTIAHKTALIENDNKIVSVTPRFQSLRSDYQGLAICYSPNKLIISGSPASLQSTNNVFGSDNILECFKFYIRFIAKQTGIFLPTDPTKYRCTRIDVTENYDVGSQEIVNKMLEFFKYSNTHGKNVERKNTTVYWSKSSSYRSAKAYNKYLHANKMMASDKQQYTLEQLELTKRLLRLELKLGRDYLNELEMDWHQMTAQILQFEHKKYFDRVVSRVKVPQPNKIMDYLIKVCPSEGTAKATFTTWVNIQNLGNEHVRGMMSKSSYYRHISFLKKIGVTPSDIHKGELIALRPISVDLNQSVQSWGELRANNANYM